MRRQLEKEVQQLRSSELVFSVALRKDFVRKPAYWVEIYAIKKGKYRVYCVARQWHFYKKDTNETIQSESVSPYINNFTQALNRAHNAIKAKTDNKWLICENQYNQDPAVVNPNNEELLTINQVSSMWNFSAAVKESKTTIKKEQLPRSEKFKRAQRKRKAKAEW